MCAFYSGFNTITSLTTQAFDRKENWQVHVYTIIARLKGRLLTATTWKTRIRIIGSLIWLSSPFSHAQSRTYLSVQSKLYRMLYSPNRKLCSPICVTVESKSMRCRIVNIAVLYPTAVIAILFQCCYIYYFNISALNYCMR